MRNAVSERIRDIPNRQTSNWMDLICTIDRRNRFSERFITPFVTHLARVTFTAGNVAGNSFSSTTGREEQNREAKLHSSWRIYLGRSRFGRSCKKRYGPSHAELRLLARPRASLSSWITRRVSTRVNVQL